MYKRQDAGIEVVFDKAIPMGVKDVSSIIEEAKSKNAKALLCCAYPDENFAVMDECIASDYNPDVILFGPGACFEVFYQIYGCLLYTSFLPGDRTGETQNRKIWISR